MGPFFFLHHSEEGGMFHLMDERLADKLTKVANVTAQLKRQPLMFTSQAVMSLSFSSMSRIENLYF